MKDTKYFAEEGRNYIKIVHDKSYGQKMFSLFHRKESILKFGVGDILMAASWKTWN